MFDPYLKVELFINVTNHLLLIIPFSKTNLIDPFIYKKYYKLNKYFLNSGSC